MWTGADSADLRRPEYNTPPELYCLDCVAYESLVLGMFTIWHGERPEREKPNDISLGYSRDGFHWTRPSRDAFIGVSEDPGAWNWANVQSAGGCCLIVGDRLYFYVSGRQGDPGTNRPGICSTGLATLRRDGFASLTDDRATPQPVRVSSLPASVTTRPIRFSGSHLFVNAEAAGSIRVEVLDAGGRALPGFGAAQCAPVQGNGTRLPVSWPGATLGALAGETVRFRFRLDRGRLYSFWVSATAAGASGGYVGAGGPSFHEPRRSPLIKASRVERWLPLALGVAWWLALYPGLVRRRLADHPRAGTQRQRDVWFTAWWIYVIQALQPRHTRHSAADALRCVAAGVERHANGPRQLFRRVGRANGRSGCSVPSPLVGALGIQVRHDAWMTAGFLLCLSPIARSISGHRAAASDYLKLVLAVLLIPTRHNGLGTLIAAAAIGLMALPAHRWRFAGTLTGVAAGVFVVTQAATVAAGRSHSIDPVQAVEWMMADVSCMVTEPGVEPTG